MNQNTESLTLEVMPPEVAAVTEELSAPKETALTAFTPFQKLFADSALLLAKEKEVNTPKEARELRLEMRKHRSTCKSTKDTVKADILLAGRLADAYFNRVTRPLENAESRLEEIEKEEERRLAAEREARRVARLAELSAVGMDGAHFPLGEMLPEPYAQLLSGAKLAHEAKIAAEAKAKEEARIAAEKAEAERVAREAAELAERERIKAEAERLRIENERLAKERAEAEKAAEIERQRVAKEKAEAESKAAAELKAAQEKARKERDAIEAEAKKQADEAARLAKIEREKREELERAEAARVAAENQRIADEKDAAARAAAAPDRDKLAALGVHLNQIQWPEMETEGGKLALRRIKAEVATIVETIRAEYKALGKEAGK